MTIEELKNNGWKDESGNLWNDPNESEWRVYPRILIEPIDDTYMLPSWFIKRTGSDQLLKCKPLKILLKENGRTLEEYYSRFLLNISEVPICENEGCYNIVHVRDGRICRGLTKCCCRSCHISKRNRILWTDPNYIMNSPEFKLKKSKEMSDNLSVWNYDPKFQAKSKRGKVLSHDTNYVFYIARTASQSLKFGVAQSSAIDWRLYIQKEWNEDEYISFHVIFESDNIYMADFEYKLKEKFDFREYIEWSEFNKLKEEIRILRNQ